MFYSTQEPGLAVLPSASIVKLSFIVKSSGYLLSNFQIFLLYLLWHYFFSFISTILKNDWDGQILKLLKSEKIDLVTELSAIIYKSFSTSQYNELFILNTITTSS